MSSTPQLVGDLLRLLFDLALPAAMCSMLMAGLALRQEGGVNFEVGGRFQRWVLWTVIFLTVPQTLSWFASHGIVVPTANATSPTWVTNLSSIFNNFVSEVVVARVVPLLAAYFVMKALLDGAQGQSPLPSLICAIFLLSLSSTLSLMQRWNSGTEFALTDMLYSGWNYLAGTILPEAAALAVIAAVVCYMRQRPVAPLIAAALGFLSVTALWKLIQAMVMRG